LAKALPDAGYIQAYPPGVRENGGQYSHAGVWALMAQARAAVAWPDDGSGTGRAHAADLVYRDFTWLSPAHRAADPSHGALYQIEPYVMAGDVYSQPPWTGRGGWSWYTGSSAWLHRAAIESIFGLDLRASTLTITPCLPSAWPRAEITLQRAGRSMRFILLRDTVQAARQLSDELGARLLESGVSLDWSLLTGACSFVLAVP
jgi:cyclic beta-1,2-glucan synthetase